jgi:hypothetical protein
LRRCRKLEIDLTAPKTGARSKRKNGAAGSKGQAGRIYPGFRNTMTYSCLKM